MQIQRVYVKTRAEFGKQCIFDECGPRADEVIQPNPQLMNDYITRTHGHKSSQCSTQFALHEVQAMGLTRRNSGMVHTEGGWPKEINPKDEEVTSRYRRRIEKDDNWAPRLRNLFSIMEYSILQNSAVNIHQHYFDNMVPTPNVEPLEIRTVNVFSDPAIPRRPVSNISWSPDGMKIAVSSCFLEFGRSLDYSHTVHIWDIENPNTPYLTLEPFSPSIVTEYNPRDPSVLCTGLMSGQVCSWDTRVGSQIIQASHPLFSHRDVANAVKWVPTKTNTEFFSMSTDGCAFWWDTRNLHHPTEVLVFDLEDPNHPDMDRAIGVSCLNFGPMVGTKFTFGMENGMVLTGSRKARTNSEKLASRFDAHYGPVLSVDCNVFNNAAFLTVGDWRARVWIEDTKEGCLSVSRFLPETPTGGCWNKAKLSAFFIMTATGLLLAFDLLQGLDAPVFSLQLCPQRLTALAPHLEGSLMALGNSVGKVFLVKTANTLQTFERPERSALSEYLDRCSRFTKAVDSRVKEIKLTARPLSKEDLVPLVESRKNQKYKVKRLSKKSTYSDKGRYSGVSKTRSIKSIGKDKRRFREDMAELAEVEDKFNEIVAQEREKMRQESVLEFGKISQHAAPRRPIGRKVERHARDSEKREKLVVQPQVDRKGKRLRPTRLKKDTSEMFIERRKQQQDTTRTLLPLLTSSSELGHEKGKARKKATIRSVKVCKPKICKPRVCCRRTFGSIKSRARDASETRETEARRAHFEGGVEKGKGSKVKSKVIDERKEQRAATNISGRGRLRMFREMMRSPTILTAEVEKAKREIQGQSSEKTERVFIPRRRSKDSAQKSTVKSRDRGLEKQGSKQQQKKVVLKVRGEDSKADQERVGTRRGTSKERGSSRDSQSSRKIFESLLGSSLQEKEEDSRVRGKDYLDRLEPRPSGLYPRISDVRFSESR